MKRHDTDVFSLVSGVLFATLGVVFALNARGTITLDLGVVPAMVFIVFGLGILASVLASARPSAAPTPSDGDEEEEPPASLPPAEPGSESEAATSV